MCHSQTRLCSAVLPRCEEPTEAGYTAAFQKLLRERRSLQSLPTKVKDVILLPLSKQSPFVNSGCFLCQRIAEPRALILRKLTRPKYINSMAAISRDAPLPLYKAPQVVFTEGSAHR